MMSATIDGDTKRQYKLSMLAMVVFGVGEILGCFFIGFIVDKFGSRIAAMVNVFIILLMTGATLAFLFHNEFGFLAFLMSFLWGF